ncbi:MAG: putative phosphoglycerate mutase [Rhodobacteraceae bacterium HLUCCO07]|nr:MAG: putative phosphoglycerate mutase [Rhodobacteraceae bacterium HLUCCO07]
MPDTPFFLGAVIVENCMGDRPPLYLLRHGQTTWNAAGRVQGQLESELSELGRDHARRQGEILARLDLPEGLGVYCSPQRRTRQTAELALGALGLEPLFDDRLKEIHLGAWEGRYYADLTAQDRAFFEGRSTLMLCLDGPGETLADMQVRVGAFLDDLDGPALVVSHGVALTVLRGLVLGLDVAGMEGLGAEQGVIYELRNGAQIVHR